MSESAIVEYKTTNFWNKDLEKSIIWNDFDIQCEAKAKNLASEQLWAQAVNS